MNKIDAGSVLKIAALWLVSLLVAACGGGNVGGGASGAPGTPAFVAATQSAILSSAGGAVSLTAADGTVIQFDLPPGAVLTDTTFTLTTQAQAAGQRFNVLLQPPGLVFVNGLAATLTITLPSGQNLPANGALAYDGSLLPYTRLPDGRLQASLNALAGTAPANAVVRALQAGGRWVESLLPGKRVAASVNACGGAPLMQNMNGGLTALDAVEIELYGQCMVAAVRDLAANEQFAQAVNVALSVAGYLQRTGSGDAGGFISQASSIACIAYGQALERGRTTTITGMGSLYGLVKPIMFWEKTVQALGTSCNGIASDAYQTVIHDKTSEAIAFYAQVKPNLTDTTSSGYGQAKTEAAQSSQAKNEVLALNPAANLRNTLDTEVGNRAQPGVLDAMLQAPWLRCRNAQNQDELIALMTTLGNPDAVKKAAQYCGTQLTVQAKDAQGTVAAQLAQPLGGVNAGSQRVTDYLVASKTGRLSLNGPIMALRCPAGSNSGSENLLIKIDGATIQTLISPPYVNNPLEIDLAQALEAAHPGATANLTFATLTVERTGAPCGGFWGDNPAPLLSLTLQVGPPKILYGRDGAIFTANDDGTGETRLTPSNTGYQAAWSRDQSKIAFSVNDGLSVNLPGYDIYVMNADGSGLTNLGRGGGSSVSAHSPAWSPDGTRIAFTQLDLVGFSRSRLCIMKTDGTGVSCFAAPGEVIRLPQAVGPSWSPDGAKIAFNCLSYDRDPADPAVLAIYRQDICVMDADGGNQVNLTASFCSSCRSNSPDWSPDGTRIAFHYLENDISTVSLIGASGGMRTGLVVGRSPKWSPDGVRLVFYAFSVAADPASRVISLVSAQGGAVTPLNLPAMSPNVFPTSLDW